jgi:hypothetical protein
VLLSLAFQTPDASKSTRVSLPLQQGSMGKERWISWPIARCIQFSPLFISLHNDNVDNTSLSDSQLITKHSKGCVSCQPISPFLFATSIDDHLNRTLSEIAQLLLICPTYPPPKQNSIVTVLSDLHVQSMR